FVDTGKAIAVRKGGMTDSAVAVALELAKEKFGSTLTIKGSRKFKDQVVEVAARNNLDVHFTDKAMNKLFEERKAELAIEKGGQRIEQPDTGKTQIQEKTADESTVDEKIRETVSTEENTQNATQPERAKTAEAEKQNIHEGVLLDHGAAPFKFKPDLNKPEDKRDDSYFVKLRMADGKTKTLWGVGLESAVDGLRNGERVKFKDRGVEHVKWQEEQKDGSFAEKSGQRRIWEGTPLDRERENDKETTTPERQSSEREQDNDEPEYDL
ncbi:TPA: molybdopterin-guanine dinucleotide biosynthesis protein MobB, partial [Vibrio vulnificus]|nr:molybdopterin-guanine dinucleotide biosynthesis protein MobB [Vibrio vulnificus]